MKRSTTPDPRFRSWLAEQGSRRAPDDLLAQTMGQVRATPQERGWLARWPMMRFAVPIAAGLVIVAAVMTGLLFPNLPTPVGPGRSASPSLAATSEPEPTATRTEHATADWPTASATENGVPAQIDLAGTGFWTLETPLTASDWALRVGTLDGRVTRQVALMPGMGPLDLSLIPEPAGPANGQVLYVADDGLTASLHAVDALTGDDRKLTSTDAIIPRLAIDPAGTSALYATFDRQTGDPLGVFRIAVGGGQPDELLTFPSAAADATLVAQVALFPQLAVSTDGSWVVFASCRPAGCDVYAVTPDQSRLHGITGAMDYGETIVGIAGDLLIGESACTEVHCDGFAVDLETGERWPLGGSDHAFDPRQVIVGPHGPVALTESDTGDQGIWQVEALDLTDRTRTPAFTATYQFGYTVVKLAESSAGAELPPGWFLVYRNADAAPAPYPNYSAAQLGGSAETPLAIMTFPHD